MNSNRERPQRIPLNTLAIAFGLAGLADIWSVASPRLGVSPIVSGVLWGVAAVAWLALIVTHGIRGVRSADGLGSQLRHPAQGPIAAIVPVVAMLLGAQLYAVWPVAGATIVLVAIGVAALFAAWQLGFLVSGRLKLESVHGAYFLPTVAASLVAAATSATIGLHGLAIAAFAVGIFFWVVIFALLFARLAFLPPLPDALMPTLAIIVAPPAVGGTAWFAIMGERNDLVSTALVGLTVLMLLMQFALIPRYRRLSFSLGFWSFTFPFAAVGGYGIEWLALARPLGWQGEAIVLLSAATVLIVAIGVRSLVLVASVRRGARRAETQLLRADTLVER